jgi:hypothetical protein
MLATARVRGRMSISAVSAGTWMGVAVIVAAAVPSPTSAVHDHRVLKPRVAAVDDCSPSPSRAHTSR